MSDDLHLAALDADTGDVRWRHSGRDIAGVCVTPVIVDDAVLATHAPGWLVAYALGDGTRRWQTPLEDAWPVALGSRWRPRAGRDRDRHGDRARDRRRIRPLATQARTRPAAGRPYSRAPGGARLPLVVTGDQVWTATFDELVGLDVATGTLVTRVGAGTEIATVVTHEDRGWP